MELARWGVFYSPSQSQPCSQPRLGKSLHIRHFGFLARRLESNCCENLQRFIQYFGKILGLLTPPFFARRLVKGVVESEGGPVFGSVLTVIICSKFCVVFRWPIFEPFLYTISSLLAHQRLCKIKSEENGK